MCKQHHLVIKKYVHLKLNLYSTKLKKISNTIVIFTLLIVSCSSPSKKTNDIIKPERPAQVACSESIPPFVVLEMFSSESCWDCPKSEEALNHVVQSIRSKGVNVIAIAEHVDFWNDLIDSEGDCEGNWVDKYSSGFYTTRQFAYALKHDTIPLTPQIFANGSVVASDPRIEHMEAIIDTMMQKKPLFGVCIEKNNEETDLKKGILSIDFKINELKEARSGFRKKIAAQLQVFVVESGITSYPDKAENCGKELHHDNIARAYTLKTLRNASEGTVSISLPDDVVLENCSVVAMIQNLMNLEIIGGTVGFDLKQDL